MASLSDLTQLLEYVNTQQPWVLPAAVLVYSAIVGSFITCMVHRVPYGANLRNPPSYCPKCKNTLGVKQLVPIVSYLFYHGKCAFCGVGIPIRYLIIELCTVFSGLFAWLVVGASIGLIPLLLCGWGVVFSVSCFLLEKHINVKVLLFSIICFLVFLL